MKEAQERNEFSIWAKRLLAIFLISGFLCYTCWVDLYANGKSEVTASTARGKLLFQKYNCQACHQIYGLGGYLGPDLTNVYSTKDKGAAYMFAFLKNGTSIMPNFHLRLEEVNDLISYLRCVDSTNESLVNRYTITWYGAIVAKGNEY